MRELIDAAPQALSFDELVRGSRGRREEVAQILLATTAAGVTELRTMPLRLTANVSEHPVASPLARWQASRGLDLTSLSHATVRLEGDSEIRVLAALDGSRRREEFDTGVLETLARMGLLLA